MWPCPGAHFRVTGISRLRYASSRKSYQAVLDSNEFYMRLHKVQAHTSIQNGLRRFRREKPTLFIQYPSATMAIKKWCADLCFYDSNMLSYG